MCPTTFSDEIEAAARVVVEHAAIQDEPLAFGALRRAGYTSRFIGAAWQQIADRARDMADDEQEAVH